jgi:endo-beta-N-acetylglucosaminidase D
MLRKKGRSQKSSNKLQIYMLRKKGKSQKGSRYVLWYPYMLKKKDKMIGERLTTREGLIYFFFLIDR